MALLAKHPQADGLLSVVETLKPPQWIIQPDGPWLGTTPWPADQPAWLPNGAIYLFRPAAVLAGQDLLQGRVLLYCMDKEPAHRLDVDTPVDFQLARMVMQQHSANTALTLAPENLMSQVF